MVLKYLFIILLRIRFMPTLTNICTSGKEEEGEGGYEENANRTTKRSLQQRLRGEAVKMRPPTLMYEMEEEEALRGSVP